jgi:outer membrane protein OmpA-like peptidoglycan-associated protein
MRNTSRSAIGVYAGWLCVLLPLSVEAADLPGAKDPPEMKRYEGSEIVGYRAPKFEEFVLPLATPTSFSPPAYQKSLKVEGLMSRYTYVAPEGRSGAEVFRNYKSEFQRLGIKTLYEKGAGAPGWFGPTFERAADEDGLGQILPYNEADERVLVGASSGSAPAHYYLFVTSYRDGVIPERLRNVVAKGRVIAHLTMIAPEQMEQKMTFVNAEAMAKSLTEHGKVALYGIYFDTDKDVVREDSQATLQEIAKLLKSQPQLKVRVVGHTDNQGAAAHNLDLSKRRAANVTRDLTSKYAIAADRLDAFGCGWYAPVASNDSEDGRAKNRRVELVKW